MNTKYLYRFVKASNGIEGHERFLNLAELQVKESPGWDPDRGSLGGVGELIPALHTTVERGGQRYNSGNTLPGTVVLQTLMSVMRTDAGWASLRGED